jgi:hypothetical protein
MATLEVRPKVDAFVRLDVASLLLTETSIGFRSGNLHPSLTDSTWFTLWTGLRWRVL